MKKKTYEIPLKSYQIPMNSYDILMTCSFSHIPPRFFLPRLNLRSVHIRRQLDGLADLTFADGAKWRAFSGDMGASQKWMAYNGKFYKHG